MTIREAIEYVDSVKHNTFSRHQKLTWLSRLEAMLYSRIHSHYEGCASAPSPITPDTDPETLLTLPQPWDEMYLRYLELQMDYLNGEIDRYNNSSQLFDGLFHSYAAHFHRTHMPKGKGFVNF